MTVNKRKFSFGYTGEVTHRAGNQFNSMCTQSGVDNSIESMLCCSVYPSFALGLNCIYISRSICGLCTEDCILYTKGYTTMFVFFKPRKVVKLHKDHHCNICMKGLKDKWHTELSYIVTVRVCPECRDMRRSFITYLADTIADGTPINKIQHFLNDMRLMDVQSAKTLVKNFYPQCTKIEQHSLQNRYYRNLAKPKTRKPTHNTRIKPAKFPKIPTKLCRLPINHN